MARFSGISCGIKKEEGRKDLGLIFLEDRAEVFGFFTSNRIKSEAVERAEALIGGRPNRNIKAIYVISGNALCRYIGVERDIDSLVRKFAQDIRGFSGERVRSDQIVLLSTGKIGVKLDVQRVLQNSFRALENLKEDADDFSEAILTTDTRPKVVTFERGALRIIGVAKGAGMIFPDFSSATTLSFVVTNSYLPKGFERFVYRTLQRTIGSLNIDSSRSTNDSAVFVFENKVKVSAELLKKGMENVLDRLSKLIAQDGEGVRHVVRLRVFGAEDDRSARGICDFISFSLLLRSSIAGCSPDFGRLLAAIGASGERIGRVKAWVIDHRTKEKVAVIRNSKILTENLRRASQIMENQSYSIDVDVGTGKRGSSAITITDITEDYIKINKSM